MSESIDGTCPECGEEFDDYHHVTDHLHDAHNAFTKAITGEDQDWPITCPCCPETFTREEHHELADHVTDEHELMDRIVQSGIPPG